MPALLLRSLQGVIAIVVSALLLLSVHAQGPKGKKYALLVGITKYKNAKLPELMYTENDVETLAAILRSPSSGFDEVRVLSVSRGEKNPEDAPTKGNINKALKKLLFNKERNDTILIGLAGHGVQLTVKDPKGKEGTKSYPYFCPVDADFLQVDYATGKCVGLILLDNLLARVGDCGATNRLVLIDACRNDVDAESRTRNATVEGAKVPKGVGVLYSCRSGEKAWETKKLGEGHGVFFYHVARGLKGEAKNTRGQGHADGPVQRPGLSHGASSVWSGMSKWRYWDMGGAEVEQRGADATFDRTVT